MPVRENGLDDTRALVGARVAFVESAVNGRFVVERVARARGSALFVKRPRHAKDLSAVDVLRHETLLTKAARAVGPTIARSKIDGALVTEDVGGSARVSFDAEACAVVGTALAKLHNSKIPKGAHPLAGGATLKAVWHELGAGITALVRARVLPAADAKRVAALRKQQGARLSDLIEELAWSDDDEPARALCHGDVRPHNVFFTARGARFIDFELGGVADPAIDLARTGVLSGMSDHQFFRLVDAYADAARDEEIVVRAAALWPLMPLVHAVALLRRAHAAQHGKLPHLDASGVRAAQRAAQAALKRALTHERGVRS